MVNDEECRIRPLISLLDSSATRDNIRKQILDRLHELLKKNETTRREFLSCNGIEAVINTLTDNDNKELTTSCISVLNTLVQNGHTKKLALSNATVVLLQLLYRILSDDKDLSHSEILTKNVIGLLINIRPKDPGFCTRCLNSDGVGILLRIVKSNNKVQLKALNLMKLIASYPSCAKEIVNSMSMLLTFCTVTTGRRNTGQVKVTLQVITKSIKTSKQLSTKSASSIQTVVELINSWHKYDKKHGGRLLQIRKSLLNLLSAMIASKECRNKLAENEVMVKLYNVCNDMLETRAPEQLIKQLVNILNKSLPLIIPPYNVINDVKSETKFKPVNSEEDIVPVLDQFPNLRIFDQYLAENSFDLERRLNNADSDIYEGTLPENRSEPTLRHERDNAMPHVKKSIDDSKKLYFPKLQINGAVPRKHAGIKGDGLDNNQSVSLPSLIMSKKYKKDEVRTMPRSMLSEFSRSKSFTAIGNEALSLTNLMTVQKSDEYLPGEQSWKHNIIWPENNPVNKSLQCDYNFSQFRNSIRKQEILLELSSKTKTLDSNGMAITGSHLPACELYGQLSLKPVSQIKTKLSLRPKRLFENVDRLVNKQNYLNKLVYVSTSPVGEIETNELIFDSNFESGNLHKAYLARSNEYDLWLNADYGMDNHRQWFFFQVKNMKQNTVYRFNIMNNEKKDSQFGKGMQPVVYSMKEALQGNPSWRRTGRNIVYLKNNYKNRLGKQHYTVTFELEFEHSGDTCFIAYHYPYTYTRLKADLDESQACAGSFVYNRQVLCKTLLNNDVDLLTITADDCNECPISSRDYVIISARVHPGESNASWVMKGIIDYLTSTKERACDLRKQFIFKLIPMLNPDGCIIGNHRTNYAKLDLNRQWEGPTKEKSPSIYYLKGLMTNLVNSEKKIFCYVDLHGHSVKKNGFLFGCENTDEVLELPKLMNSLPMFSRSNCRFQLTREKCARVVAYRRLGIPRSYTLETTYNGCDQGHLANMQITESELCELGVGLLLSIYLLKEHSLRGNTTNIKDGSIGSNSTYSSDKDSFSDELNYDTD